MYFLSRCSILGSSKLYVHAICIPTATQWRFRKRTTHKRKPTWMPVAPSKFFRIAVHPYVPPEETDLVNDLLEEYYRKFESMRKVFQEEFKEEKKIECSESEQREKEYEQFQLLLKENNKENERIKVIREQTMEKELQDYCLNLLHLEENRKIEEEKTKKEVEEIVKRQKEKMSQYIIRETLDAAIEKAMDNPININFAVNVNGDVIWEGKPPPDFEKEVKRRILDCLEG